MTKAIVRAASTPNAKVVLAEINETLKSALAAEGSFQHARMRLGRLLDEAKKREYWRTWGHESFGTFVKELAEKYRIGRTQLYAYYSTAKELRDYVSDENLEEMGISKAQELKRAVKQTGQAPDVEIVSRALEPSVTRDDVRKLIFERYSMPKDDAPKGTWKDIGGFYVTAEERSVLDRAYDCAMRVDPPVANDIPEWQRVKEWLLRMSQDFLSTYEEAVKRGVA